MKKAFFSLVGLIMLSTKPLAQDLACPTSKNSSDAKLSATFLSHGAYGKKNKGDVGSFGFFAPLPITKNLGKKVLHILPFISFDYAVASSLATGRNTERRLSDKGVITEYSGRALQSSTSMGAALFYKKIGVGIGLSYLVKDNYHVFDERKLGPHVYASYSDFLLLSLNPNNTLAYAFSPVTLKSLAPGAYWNTNGVGPALQWKAKSRNGIILFSTVSKYTTVGICGMVKLAR
jgi:hypothetical protein